MALGSVNFLRKGVTLVALRILMFHHEAWNCYNSKTRGPVSPKVHRQDESPALNRLIWYLSTIVRAPPSENRKCNVLILCSTPPRLTTWINIRLWWCFSVKIVRFHLTTNPGAMVIRLETEGNCWGLEKPKKSWNLADMLKMYKVSWSHGLHSNGSEPFWI